MITNPWSKSLSDASAYSKGHSGNDKDNNTNDEWGDHNCGSHSLRIGFLNIQTFPSLPAHHKNNNIRSLFHEYKLSVLGMAEMNLHWPSVPHEQQLAERIRPWFEHCKSFTACNVKNTKMRGQRGGTAAIMKGKIVSMSYGCKADPLGRWTIMTCRGKNGKNLHIVTAYRPQQNSNPYGVYQQLLQYNNDHHIDREPLQQYDQDLQACIQPLIQRGDQVVVMIDANEDLTNTSTNSFIQKMRDIGMEESILSSHPDKTPPPTRTPGKKTIDSIFCTPSLIIQKAGYAPFNGFTDHRLAWIELQWENALGKVSPIVQAPARRLKMNIPVAVDIYIQVLQQLLLQNNIHQKVKQLDQQIKTKMSPISTIMYEQIDRIITKCMLKAEKRCRKLRMGGAPYSPELALLLNTINFWRLVKRKKIGHNINMRTIIRLQSRCQIDGKPLQLPFNVCEANRHRAILAYRAFRSKAASERASWLDNLIEQHILVGDNDTATIARRIKLKEEQKAMHRRINQYVGKPRSKGVNTTIIPANEHDVEKQVDTREEVESEHLKHLSTLFQCANESPLRTAPLVHEFGYMGDTEAGDAVTNGTYIPPPNIDGYTKLFLECCQRPAHATEDGPIIQLTPTEYAYRWSKCREQTSSSPSGRHFGHYKCLHKMSSTIQVIFSTMFNIPARTGYSPKRWQRAIDVLLLKNPDDLRVHRTRPIPLIEADSNDSYKQLATQANTLATVNNLHAHEQYGGKDNHSSIQCASVKRGITDVSRQMKTPLAICSVDAQSCYDRIVHVAAFLALRYMGLAKPMILSMLHSIQNMQHQIRTSFGDSKGAYGGTSWPVPPHGTIQGNGASPMIWSAISTILFNCLKKKTIGARFVAPITGEQHQTSGFAFVDDTDLIVTPPLKAPDAIEMNASLQQSIQTWQGCLQSTGGALAWTDNNKCYWYSLEYEWNENGRWTYKSDCDDDTLTIQDSNNVIHNIYKCKPHEARKTLGVYMAPNGAMDSQVQAMVEKANQFSVRLKQSALLEYDALYAVNTRVMKTLSYPLPTTTLTQSQCTHIMKPIIHSVLAKLRVVRTIPRDLLYGPTEYQGFGLTNLYVYQGCMQIAQVVQFCMSSVELGRIQRISYQAMVMELGMNTNPFQVNYTTHEQCATPSIMKHIWKMCYEHNIILHTGLPLLQPRRSNDINLMQSFSNQGHSGAMLAGLNRCRMYLQVIWLSDITTADGMCIRQDCLKGKYIQCYQHPYEWPVQPKPGPSDWVKWRRAIKQIFSPSPPLLLLPSQHFVKEWAPQIPEDHFLWWYDEFNDMVYRIEKLPYMIQYLPLPLPQQTVYVKNKRVRVDTSILKVCTVQWYDKTMAQVCITGTSSPPTNNRQPTVTFTDYIKKEVGDEQWVLNHLTLVGDINDIVTALGRGTLRAVSDGSCDYKLGIGTAGWCIHSRQAVIRGVNRTPSGSTKMDSMRSELSGIYSIIIVIEAIAKQFNVLAGSVTIGSDCDSALNETLLRASPLPYNKITGKHLDFVNAINNTNKQSRIKYKAIRIKGHQDAVQHISQLTWWEQRNVEMNDLAKSFMQHLRQLSPAKQFSTSLKNEGWTITIDNVKVTGDIINTCHHLICKAQVLKYWERKGRFKQLDHHKCIDTANMNEVLRDMPLRKKIWVLKFNSGYCATGQQMYKRDKWSTPKCPFCNHSEDTTHIIQCLSNTATSKWQEIMNGFAIKLAKINTPQNTIRAIIIGMSTHRLQTTLINEWASPTLQAAMAKQTMVGWNLFNYGYLVWEWESHFNTFLPPLKSARKWAQQLIHLIIECSWQMWDHRCKLVHSTSTQEQDEIDAIDQRIRQLHDQPLTAMHQYERVLFRANVSIILQQTTKYKRLWVQRAERLFTVAEQRQQNQLFYSSERRTMRRWLGVIPSTPQVISQPNHRSDRSSHGPQTKITRWAKSI